MFAPTVSEQSTNDLSLTKAVYIEDQTIAFRIEDEGTVKKPILNYTLFANKNISESVKTELLDRIKFFLSLEDDLKPFYDYGMNDKAFKPVIKNLYGLHQVKFLTPFEAAGWAVLSQRISMKVAHNMKERITHVVGDKITIDDVEYWTFPSANQVKNLGVEKLTTILNNRRKSEYLMNVSESFANIEEDFLRYAPLEEVKNWLLNIKGIGEYSAHLELIRGLGRMDDISQKDMMLIKCAKNYYGSDVVNENLNEIAEGYRDYKGYWAYYLRSDCSNKWRDRK